MNASRKKTNIGLRNAYKNTVDAAKHSHRLFINFYNSVSKSMQRFLRTYTVSNTKNQNCSDFVYSKNFFFGEMSSFDSYLCHSFSPSFIARMWACNGPRSHIRMKFHVLHKILLTAITMSRCKIVAPYIKSKSNVSRLPHPCFLRDSNFFICFVSPPCVLV